MNYEHLTDIEKVDLIHKILASINDEVVRIWRIAWGLGHKECMSAWEYDKTRMLIEQFTYTKVREAFQASAEQGVFNLRYVRGILEKQTTRESADKAEEENRLFKLKEKREIEERLKQDAPSWNGFADNIFKHH